MNNSLGCFRQSKSSNIVKGCSRVKMKPKRIMRQVRYDDRFSIFRTTGKCNLLESRICEPFGDLTIIDFWACCFPTFRAPFISTPDLLIELSVAPLLPKLRSHFEQGNFECLRSILINLTHSSSSNSIILGELGAVEDQSRSLTLKGETYELLEIDAPPDR